MSIMTQALPFGLVTSVLALAPVATAGEWVDWRASGYLVPILQEATLLNVEPLPEGESVDLDASTCHAHIYRPDLGEPPAVRDEHAIVCDVKTNLGRTLAASASLAQIPVLPWGNRFTRNVFQVKERAFASRLFNAMQKVHQEHGATYPVSYMEMASPGAGLVLHSYYLDVSRDPYSAAYLTCDGNWEWKETGTYELYNLFCTFQFPTGA